MKLPRAAEATIRPEKVLRYLLSLDHPRGQSKARFFLRFGFSTSDSDVLTRALRKHAATHDVASVEETPFGTRYVVDGPLTCPDGRRPLVRVVWFIEHGSEIPRFATAYPLESR